MIPTLRAAFRLALLVLWTVLLVPAHSLARPLDRRRADWIPRLWHRGVRRIIGLRVAITGQLLAGRPVLFVANHVSYLDIVALGAILDGSFVAKSEVARWPVIGRLARLQGTVFIERRAERAGLQTESLRGHLAAGRNLILFPEGTSSDGGSVLAFRSSLFEATRDIPGLAIQPISLSYLVAGGRPIEGPARELVAWYGAMELPSHLWTLLGLSGARLEIGLHRPVDPARFGTRKELAAHCETLVRHGLRTYGREGPAGDARLISHGTG